MPYIIDGNNVMGQTPGWHRDKPAARTRLLAQLAVFAKLKRIRVTAVFDGGADDRFPEGSAYQGVKVLYAERGSDADRRILKLIESSADPAGITVVTSDRQLAFLVRSAGARTVRSGEFRRNELERFHGQDSGQDRKPSSIDDLDRWMRYFGVAPEDDLEDLAED